MVDPGVARRGDADTASELDDHDARITNGVEELRRSIRRPVVHYDELEIDERLVQHASHR